MRAPYSGAETCSIGHIDDVKKVKGVNIWPQSGDDLVFGANEVDEHQLVSISSATEAGVATVRIMPEITLSARKVGDVSGRVAKGLRQRTGISFAVECSTLIPWNEVSTAVPVRTC